MSPPSSPPVLALLACLRKVNRLLAGASDPDQVIEAACHILLETRNVDTVWIVRTDQTPSVVGAAQAGMDPDTWKNFKTALRSETPPPCFRKASTNRPTDRAPLPESEFCTGCPLYPCAPERDGLSFRLETPERIHGVIGITAPPAYLRDDLEIALLNELALHLAMGLEALHQRREQDRIRKQQEFQSMLLHNISDLVLATDLEGTILFANEASARRLGRKPGELLGKSVRVLGDDPERGATQEEIVRETYRRGSWRTEVVNRHTDGHDMVLDCRTRLLRDEEGHPNGMVGISTDITEQRRSQEALRCNQEWLARIIRHAPYGILIADEHQRYLEANPAGLEILGRTEEELVQLRAPDVLIPEHRAPCEASFEQLLSGKSVSGELHVARKDGDVRETRFQALPIGADRYLCFVEDMTDQNRLREQFQQAQKMESVGRLAGGIAHDFNNLLMGVMACTDMLETELESGHAALRWIEDIRREVDRSSDLIRQLLTFARQQPSRPKVVDLNHRLDSMRNMLTRLIGENIRLDWRADGTLWPVRLDPVQLDQILANLFVNARDAIDDVGVLTVKTANLAMDGPAPDFPADAPPGDYVRLSIIDTGQGMDAKTLENIFDPFFTTKSSGKGTGLGLATVYGIVRQNRGYIEVDSTPGKGTAFHLFFPRSETPTNDDEDSGPKENSDIPGGGETILLVEDEAPIRNTMSMMLRHIGYTVHTAANPEEALALLEPHGAEIDLLLTDVIMPGMNGRELADVACRRLPTLRVLYMSGYNRDVLDAKAVDEGGIDFLPKPCSARKLARTLRSILDRPAGIASDT